MDRRQFLKNSTLAGLGSILPVGSAAFPQVITKSRVEKKISRGEIIFQPHFVQTGNGPHIYPLAWTTDKNWDTFHSNIEFKNNLISVCDTGDNKKFGINIRWNVEGFGYTNITADNGGHFYELPADGKTKKLNLNYEFANSRVARNRLRSSRFVSQGWIASPELKAYINLSEEILRDAEKNINDAEKCAVLSQKSLMYALWASEMLELEKANYDILKNGKREGFFFGCDARSFYQMYQDKFLDLFNEVFNYANITFVAKGDGMMSDYQSAPGVINPATRELLIKKLAERGIKSQERLLFWFHDCCIPDWLRNMKFDELKKYAEKLTYDTMKRFGGMLHAMEVVNELHDWANELHLTPDQITELARLINDVAKSVAPNVKRTVNNCCPFAEYVQMQKYSGSDAKCCQRSPYKFSKDLIDAGIDFDILEQQMYYPYRDLQDSVIIMENLASLGKPMQISEIGVSGGPTNETIKTGQVKMPNEPYLWHRPWDEETQADWLEDNYTVYYANQNIHAINWFDFIDPGSFMENGGILRTVQGEKKESFHRLKKLQARFNSL
jgi:hypothetical protein